MGWLDGPWCTSASWKVTKGVHIVFIFSYFYVYKCPCLSVSMPYGCSASWGQERVLGPLERGVNKSLWASVLRTKLFYISSQNLICTFCHSFIGFLSLLMRNKLSEESNLFNLLITVFIVWLIEARVCVRRGVDGWAKRWRVTEETPVSHFFLVGGIVVSLKSSGNLCVDVNHTRPYY